MAGEDPGFNLAEVKATLRAAMFMGMPTDRERRPVFHFPRERTYDPADRGGLPYDWTQPALTDSDPDPARVVYCGDQPGEVLIAWEAAGGRGGTQSVETPFGDFDAPRLVVTVFLDPDYALIDGFSEMWTIGNRYRYQKQEPHFALHDLDVVSVTVEAIDES